MRRIFTLMLGALAMVAVALISAFITMRLAIHGREAVVPTLTGLNVSDAAALARHAGLSLTLENRFYSAGVPAGRILAQGPAAGSRVRREWPVRITESLGAQAVNIPDLTGESERAATVSIRRLSLDLGTVGHLSIAGDPGVVLTQTPPANTGGVDGPRVSLLVSDAEDAAPTAYVMPSLLGLTLSAAQARTASAGLTLTVASTAAPALASTNSPAQAPAQQAAQTLAQPPIQSSAQASPAAAPGASGPAQSILTLITNPSPMAVRAEGVITSQTPQAGRRVVAGDAVRVSFGLPASANPPASK